MPARRKTPRSRKSATPKSAGKTTGKTAARKAAPKRWSQRVTRESDALDLKPGVFKLTSPRKIAASLKRSAEHSSRRKASAYRSALSMLTFYINRAGKTLPKARRDRLERAKTELKRQFGRDQTPSSPAGDDSHLPRLPRRPPGDVHRAGGRRRRWRQVPPA
jgi:hypothetical protein